MDTVFLFPGQGSQCSGMGKDLYDNFSVAKDVFDAADDYLNYKISKVCFEGDEEQLKQTQLTQPAIATVSIACLEVLKSETGLTPKFLAGHSLGEYPALYAAGVLTLEQTMKFLWERGRLMSSAKSGGMAAVIGSDNNTILKAINEIKNTGYVGVANYNSQAQTVLTGEKEALAKAGEYLTQNGAKRFIPLAVSGAFHSEFMREISSDFQNFIQNYEISDAKIPVVTNVDAEFETKKEIFKTKMVQQLYSSVHWYQSILKMNENGAERYIEIGPGRVLTGLNKKILPEAEALNISNTETMKNFIDTLNKE